MSTTRYRIIQTETGESLGVYEGADGSEAIAAMLADAGCTDPPDPGLRTFPVPSYCTQNGGDCSTCSLVNYGRDCRNERVK